MSAYLLISDRVTLGILDDVLPDPGFQIKKGKVVIEHSEERTLLERRSVLDTCHEDFEYTVTRLIEEGFAVMITPPESDGYEGENISTAGTITVRGGAFTSGDL